MGRKDLWRAPPPSWEVLEGLWERLNHWTRFPRVLILGLSLSMLATFAGTGSLWGAGYRFVIPPVKARCGEKVRVTIKGDHEQAADGFSVALRYPASELTIERVHMEDTILEAIGTDYLEARIDPDSGTLIVGVLVDSQPPFTGTLIPTIGIPLDFVHLEVEVSPEAREDLKLRFEDGLGVPPITNLYSVNQQPVPVTELGEGVIEIEGCGEAAAYFIRGDANMDLDLDLSDPVAILGHVFRGERAPPCTVAADANDDDRVDLSDPIFLITFLFLHGSAPSPPCAPGGTDPTPGTLDCLEPMSEGL